MERRTSRSSVLMAGLLLLAACAPGTSAGDLSPAPDRGSTAELHVINRYNGPTEIYAIVGGAVHRMGMVMPGMASSFVIQPYMIGSGTVEFVARRPGVPDVHTDRFLLVPGNLVEFQVETTTSLSQNFVRY